MDRRLPQAARVVAPALDAFGRGLAMALRGLIAGSRGVLSVLRLLLPLARKPPRANIGIGSELGIQEAAAGTDQVSTTIAEVTRAADESGTAARRVLDGGAQLAAQSDSLRGEVDRFLERVRAA